MSKANKDGKERARLRAEQLRLEQQRRTQRKRRLTIYGSTIGVIVIALVVALLVQHANAPKTPTAVPAATIADTSGGVSAANGMAIPLGSKTAPVKLTVYEDFRCSACGSYESTYKTAYQALLKAGTIEMLIHPVTLIDSNNPGTSGSLHAGNAAACAQTAGKFQAYHDVLYANQPEESTDSFSSNATLITYAKQVSGLDTAAFQSCVNSGKYDDWVQQNMQNLIQISGSAGPSTPTFYANGKAWSLPTTTSSETIAQAQAAFTAALDKLAGVTPSASASASASPTGSASASASASDAPSATGSANPSASAS